MATLGNSKMMTRQAQWHSGMTELNHLGAALSTKPHLLSGQMDRLFSAQNIYSDNPLTSLLQTVKGGECEIGQMEWEWEMKGATTRPAIVIETIETSTTPGKGKATFKLKLDVPYFVPGDILTPGTSSKKFMCRVQDDNQRHGDGFLYNMVIMTDDFNEFLPVKYLKPGQQWAKMFSQYEEASEQAGSTIYGSNIAFRNKMSKYRKHYKVTDFASTEVLEAGIKGADGKTYKSWVRFAEVEFWQEWYRELERALWYSRSSDSIMGANGRPVKASPGIQEQLEDSHVHRYSHLTAKLIEEYLMDIFYSRTKPGQGRAIKAYTGEYGMLQFHRAIQDWTNKSGFIKNFEIFSDKVSNPYTGGTTALSTGYQFVKYHMANGASLELIHNPLYDDRSIHYEIDPLTGYPVESQRMTFLDFSGENATNNVKIMNRKDGYAFSYIEGLYGPYGPSKGGKSAHGGDYYTMVCSKVQAIHIGDVTKCGELLLSRG